MTIIAAISLNCGVCEVVGSLVAFEDLQRYYKCFTIESHPPRSLIFEHVPIEFNALMFPAVKVVDAVHYLAPLSTVVACSDLVLDGITYPFLLWDEFSPLASNRKMESPFNHVLFSHLQSRKYPPH